MLNRPDIPALWLPVPQPLALGAEAVLEAEEFRHFRAWRLSAGDKLQLLDGRGHRMWAVVRGRGADLRIVVERVEHEAAPQPSLVLGLAVLSDKSRIEWAVEKAVELGVIEIVPLVTERSEGHWPTERCRRVAISALKQCQRAHLPLIRQPQPLMELMVEWRGAGRVWVCHEQADSAATLGRAVATSAAVPRDHPLWVLIGPEGGFSPTEIGALAPLPAVQVVSLGPVRLRAETAAVSAVAVITAYLKEAALGE